MDESTKRKSQESGEAFISSHSSRRGENVKKRFKRESLRKTSRETLGRRESNNSRRSTETQRKTSSSRGSTGYNRGRTRGKEVAITEESPRDQPEDTDQELEVTFAAQEPRKAEKRRQPLDTDDILETFRRFLTLLQEDLRKHIKDLRKDTDNRHRYQTLIDQDYKYIRSMEDSIYKLLGECR